MRESISQAPGAAANQGAPLLRVTASWRRCTLLARSGCLIVFSNNSTNSLCAPFARPPSPRMLLHTLTWAPRTQYTKALIYWFKRASPACLSPFALLPIGALLVSDKSKNVSFAFPCPTFICKPLTWRVWQRGWRPRSSVIIKYINITKAVIVAVHETKVRGLLYFELGANSLVRGDVIVVVCLAERRVPGQSTHA